MNNIHFFSIAYIESSSLILKDEKKGFANLQISKLIFTIYLVKYIILV